MKQTKQNKIGFGVVCFANNFERKAHGKPGIMIVKLRWGGEA